MVLVSEPALDPESSLQLHLCCSMPAIVGVPGLRNDRPWRRSVVNSVRLAALIDERSKRVSCRIPASADALGIQANAIYAALYPSMDGGDVRRRSIQTAHLSRRLCQRNQIVGQWIDRHYQDSWQLLVSKSAGACDRHDTMRKVRGLRPGADPRQGGAISSLKKSVSRIALWGCTGSSLR